MNVQANELRIGNFIKYEHLGNPVKIGAVDIVHISDNNSNVSPIPLTEEWLVKLGAKKNQLPNCYYISVTNLKAELHFETFSNTDEILTRIISHYSDLIFDIIKYVHQLQNLFFALTGEELTIKDNGSE